MNNSYLCIIITESVMGCLKLNYCSDATLPKVMYEKSVLSEKSVQIWLSVDPMSDKYPSLSPYAYCANNPVILVDEDGRYIVFKHPHFMINITNPAWIEKQSKLSSIPAIGTLYEANLWLRRIQDPSFTATPADYASLAFSVIGGAQMKLFEKLTKLTKLSMFVLKANRQMVTTIIALLTNPGTYDVGIDVLAAESLMKEGKGFYTMPDASVESFNFKFNNSYIDKIENEILSDKNLTSQKNFNFKKEVQKRLVEEFDKTREEIKKSITNETK